MERRTDYKRALHIETVIHEAATHGLEATARKLASLGVPLDVSMRVLTRPALRRHHGPALDISIAPIGEHSTRKTPGLPDDTSS
jgi:hypothetical protein